MNSGAHSTSSWYLYIIRTRRGRLYTGITVDVPRRWREHCSGKAGAKFFRSDQPEALCLVEPSLSRSAASRREAAIKRLSPAEKRQLIRCQSPTVFGDTGCAGRGTKARATGQKSLESNHLKSTRLERSAAPADLSTHSI